MIERKLKEVLENKTWDRINKTTYKFLAIIT